MTPVLLWFRRNLRLRDNAALLAAVESGQPIIPVYVCDALDAGGASRWWLHHSLAMLESALAARGGRLVIRAGAPEDVLTELARETGATGLFYSRRYEPEARRQQQRLRKLLDEQLGIHSFDDSLLHHPRSVLTQSETPYKVFTPYWRAAAARGEPAKPRSAPDSIHFAEHSLDLLSLSDLALLPTAPDWSQGLRDSWQPGEDGALARIDALETPVKHYAEQRDRPDLDTTSRLSPHLHFGEISVREAWHAIRELQVHLESAKGAEALLRQFFWRDFSTYLLYHFPQLPSKPLRAEFEAFPWSENEEHLVAWQRGMTGYPIVDAGMRQLWETGWMHNRVRMIVASFLIKDLLIPWQEGADWFLDTLVDADLANNSAGWQWVAGCGTDAAPYFRIFNPTLQGEKFDPDGDYVRRWLPEIDRSDYPAPIVDHGDARARALEGYKSIRPG
ncbi:MAG: DNA photolyase family protein [Gammaproteobacteria bacterium]|nr:DNA photolyase family protein [Gammaproteobacteria bacterium]